MKEEIISDILDDIDILMAKGLNDKLQFLNENYITEIASKIKSIENEIRDSQTEIYKRFTTVTNAFMIANANNIKSNTKVNHKEFSDAQNYFSWLEEKKLLSFEKNLSIDKAIHLQDLSLLTGHEVDAKVRETLEMNVNDKVINKNLPSKISWIDKLRVKLNNLFNSRKNKKNIENKVNQSKVEKKDNQIVGAEKENITNNSIVSPMEVEYKNIYIKVKSNQRIENNRNNFSETIKVKPEVAQQTKMKSKPEIVVISDLHGNIHKWQYVKNAIRQNPNLKVIIEGDAMDRGDHGVQILMQIKELCDQGRVEYMPGNHDAFAYNYLRTQGTEYERSQVAESSRNVWEYNGGKVTKQSFENFNKIMENELRLGNITKTISKEELIVWLGHRPIQKVLTENDTQYALSHAVFDEELYKADPTFNLEKALVMELQGKRDTELFRKYMNSMWYREENPQTHYTNVVFPKKSCNGSWTY